MANSTALTRFGTRKWALAIVTVWLFLISSRGFGQETEPSAPETTTPSTEQVTDEDIVAALKDVSESTEIDDATRTQLKEIYARAKAELEVAAEEASRAAQLQAWINSAVQDIEKAKQKKDSPVQAYDISAAEYVELNELIRDRTALDQQLVDAKKLLSEAQAEPQRRVARNAEIPEELAKARAFLQQSEEQLQALTPDTDTPVVLLARKALLRARRQAQLAVVTALETEREAYAAQGELPRLRVDLETIRVKQLDEDIRNLVETINERRKINTAAQKKEAERARQAAPVALKPYAERNIDLANRRFEFAKEIQGATGKRKRIGQQLDRLRTDFARMEKRAQAGTSDTLGMILIKRRSSLPSSGLLQRSVTQWEEKIRVLQTEIYELEDRREDLSDMDSAVQSELADLRHNGIQAPPDAEQTLRELFALETQILDGAIVDANRHFSLMIAVNDDQRELVHVTGEFKDSIDRQVFWVRSAPPLQAEDVSRARAALVALADARAWREASNVFASRLKKHPVPPLLVGASLVVLLAYRRRIRTKLEDLGRVASSISCRTMRPTIEALLLTMLLAIPWGLVVWFIGWGLSGASNELVQAASFAFSRLSIGVFTLETIRQICRPLGLAEAHFNWSPRGIAVLRSNLRVLILAGLPLAFVCMICERQGDPLHQASLGRFCLIAFLLLVAWVSFRLFHPKDGVLAELLEQKPQGWANRLHKVWYPVVDLLPAALAVLAISGYQFTAFRLTVDLWRTFELVFMLWALRALMLRWVRIQRRKLRWQQYLESRQHAEDHSGSEASDLEALAAKEDTVDLASINQQTRRMIGVLLGILGLISLSAIWFETFPALAPLLDKTLWEVAGTGGALQPITVGALMFAVLVFGLAILASRNIPGLIDVMLLGRLRIESSTRYAISTLSQYAILIAGVLIACSALGLTWSKAQWLVAALSVGLGFGLQEVVANFVCGILLLFERPIRLGDTVTLGDTTGVVVRIRTRATTVRNWDRQEVVIPNKELITGRIVNWTLSDQMNRVVLQVGVAYGTDTNHAREILLKVCGENPNVLDDPKPIVTFEQFGDSTLNFIVRAYLAEMDERMETIHQLHTSVNQRFTQEGIEIAFPQHDLHLRSIDPSARPLDSNSEMTWQSPDETHH